MAYLSLHWVNNFQKKKYGRQGSKERAISFHQCFGMFSSAGSYPHVSVIVKTDGTFFFLEEYAGMSIFCWNVDFCENHAESEEERSSDGKFQHHSAFPSFSSTKKKKKKSHREYAAHSKRVDYCFVSATFGLYKEISRLTWWSLQFHIVLPSSYSHYYYGHYHYD